MFVVFWLTLFTLSQATKWDTASTNIAVIEYQPYLNVSIQPLETVIENAKQYVNQLAFITESFDMVIFPEATLKNSPETAFEININYTCQNINNNLDPVEIISCAARDYQIYIVINLVEKETCDENDQSSNCKKHNFHFYNTDVVFDRNGKIVTKYRKYNLFGEFGLDQPEKPDQVIIATDFGINFGIFTCFDILFKSPAQDLVNQDIDAIIFPTMWFSELPFLTSLQTQQMFSHTHDIPVFAAGANNPSVGSGGSGVFMGQKGASLRGILADGNSQSFIYKSLNGEVSPLPSEDVDALGKVMDRFFLKRDPSVDDYANTILNPSDGNVETVLCFEEKFCCNFSIKISYEETQQALNFYTYKLIAFSGVRTFDGVYNGGIEICAIITCLNSSLSSCGQRFPDYEQIQWPLTFEEITIVANFEISENKTQYPNSLLSSIRPIDASKTVWSGEAIEDNGNSFVKRMFSTNEKQNRLLTFGIYGRDFGNDFPPNRGSALKVVGLLMACLSVLVLLV